MKTKEIKKLFIGLTLALFAVGFSAFTNRQAVHEVGKAAPVVFYNITGTPSNNPADYVYDPNGGCQGVTSACNAEWEHTGPLTPGTNPDGAKLTQDEPGQYIPGL